MLKSCRYCGGIHDSKYVCIEKPKRRKYDTEQNKFRSTDKWTRKSKQIRRRDGYICQICIRKKYNTKQQYNSKELSVHHIVSLDENDSLRLADSNLITICEEHHKMAEMGIIPRVLLMEIAREQEGKGTDGVD